MFYTSEVNENINLVISNLNLDWLNFVEYTNFASMSAGGTAYIYETVSFLYSGYSTVSTSASTHNSQFNWADILSFIVSTSAAEILEEFEVGDIFDLDDAITNSFIISYVTAQNNNMSLFFNAPTLFVLENPELVDELGGVVSDSFFSSSVVKLTLLKNENMAYITMFSSSLVAYICFLATVYLFLVIYFYSNNKLTFWDLLWQRLYLIMSSFESEKELGSADDESSHNLPNLHIWLIWIYVYFMASKLPEFTMFMYLMPGIFYVVFLYHLT